MIEIIVSGGQTGADRAAFDVALAWGIGVGGWVPRGRAAEDGVIASHYPNLRETQSDDPAERTRLNIRDADGSLIVSHGALHGGSLLARETAARIGRPVMHVDLSRMSMADAVCATVAWVRVHDVRVLGVGGPRASDDPRIYDATALLLGEVLRQLTADDD